MTVSARADAVWKVYGTDEARVVAPRGVSASFSSGRFTAIMGPSGSGKSALTRCLAGLDTVTRGSVHIGGTEVTGLADKALTRLRRDRVGFIFQQFSLLPTLTAAEDIRLPLDIAGRVVVGAGLGAAVVRALDGEDVTELVLPWSGMGLYLATAALVGVLAAVLPSIKAARLNVLTAVAHE